MNLFAFFRRRAARKAGLFLEAKKFWPPGYISFKNPLTDDRGEPIPGATVLTDVYDAFQRRDFALGECVPLIRTADGKTHYYRVNNVSISPGDDHIVSPLLFDVEYDHAENAA